MAHALLFPLGQEVYGCSCNPCCLSIKIVPNRKSCTYDLMTLQNFSDVVFIQPLIAQGTAQGHKRKLLSIAPFLWEIGILNNYQTWFCLYRASQQQSKTSKRLSDCIMRNLYYLSDKRMKSQTQTKCLLCKAFLSLLRPRLQCFLLGSRRCRICVHVSHGA